MTYRPRNKMVWLGLTYFALLMTAMIFLTLTGCSSSQSVTQMSGWELIRAHEQHLALWGSPDMAVVNELAERGALDAEARDAYAQGAQCHAVQSDMGFYDFAALGYTRRDVIDYYGGAEGGKRSTIYTPRGAVTVRSFGGGSFTVR